jgi:hypothetical protein
MRFFFGGGGLFLRFLPTLKPNAHKTDKKTKKICVSTSIRINKVFSYGFQQAVTIVFTLLYIFEDSYYYKQGMGQMAEKRL